MKHKLSILMLLAVLIVPWAAKAQSLSDYTLQTGTTTYTSFASADSLLSSVTGDAGTQVVNLPFFFPFGEDSYSSVTVRADGYLYFGTTSPGHSCKSAWTATTNYSLIAPLITYDGKITASGATSGAYKAYMADENGDMMVAIEFKSVMCYYSDYGDYNYQVRLYPNGNISVVYGTNTPTTNTSMIHNFFLINGISDKICLTGSFASPATSSTVSALPDLATMPVSGSVLTYVRPVITCPKPTFISAIADTDQLTFYWSPGGSETDWELVVDNVSYYVTDTAYTVTGLIPDTRHEAAVRALCGAGDTSGWRSGAFRTECPPIYSFPYTEDFEDYNSGSTNPISTCWTKGTNSGTAYPYPYSNAAINGSIGLYFYSYLPSSTTSTQYYSWAALPPVDENVDMSGLMLNMKVKRYSTVSNYYTTLLYVGIADSVTGFTSATAVNSQVTWIDTIDLFSATASSIHNIEVSFADYTGDGKYVVIYAPIPGLHGTGTYCYNYAYVDDVVLRTIPTCFWPSSVALQSVTPDQATINWIPDSRTPSPSAWNLEYGVHGFTRGTGTMQTETSTFATLTSLLPNTEYDVYISADCGSDESDPTLFTFRTECSLLDSLPYTYGFEDLATGSSTVRPVIPCWHHLNNGAQYFGYPYVSSTSHTGSRSLYWYATTTTGSYGDYLMVVLPGVEPTIYPVNTLQLSFWARPSSTSYYPVFVVGVMTDPADASTFQEVETVNVANSTTWQYFTVSLGAYTGTGKYVAVRINRPSSSYYAYTDDFTLEPLPNCPSVTNLEATPTVGAAMLTWGFQAGYDAPAGYVVTYDSIGGTSPTTVNVTDANALISGLAPATTYKVYVRADCGGDGMGSIDSVTFTTGEFDCSGRSSVEFSNSTTGISGCMVNSSWGNTVYQTVWTAAELTAAGVTAGPITALDLGFTTSTNAKEFTIYLGSTTTSSISDANIESLATHTKVYGPAAHPIGTTGWQHYELDTAFVWNGTSNIMMTTFMNQPTGTSQSTSTGLTGYYVSATNKARYRYRDSQQWTPSNLTEGSSGTTYSYRAAIHFYVGECTGTAACANPFVMVTDRTANSMTLTWVPGADETSWDVEYHAIDTATWTTAATAVTSNTFTVTSLAPGTEYVFRVSFTCNDATSTVYSGTVTARTPCSEISIPYTYGFEDMATTSSTVHPIIPCWSHLNNATQYYGYPYVSSTAHNSTRSLYWYATTTTGTYGDYQIVVLPPVDTTITPVDTLQLTFWARPSSTSYNPVFQVGVMTDPENASTFQTVATVNIDGSSVDWKEYEVALNNYTGNGRYVALRANRPSPDWYAYTDDFTLDFIPSCPHPTNIHTTFSSGDSIVLAWTPGSDEEEWVVTIGDTSYVSLEDTLLITGLSPSSHYYGTVTAVCSSDDSSVAYPFHVMTACGKLTTLPYVQDFEQESTTTSTSNNFVPCWHHLNNGTSYPGYPYVSASTTYNHTENGGKGLYWYGSTTTGTYGDYHVIVLPEVDTTVLPVRTLKLSFWAKSSSTSYQPVFYVGVMSNPDSINSFVYVDTIYVGNNTNWTRFTTVFDQYADTGSYIAIRGNRPSAVWYAYVDDIVLDLVPACPPVEDVAVEAGTTSAIVHWSTVNDAVLGAMVEYKPDTATTWNSVTVSGTNYAVLTGLDGGTTYNLRVYGTCADGNATAAASHFTTTPFACEVYDTSSMVVFSDTIGNGTATSTYFPSYSFYNYGLTQQIFTPTELGHGGTISNIAFHMNAVSQQRTFEIYMGHTSNATATDFLNPTDLTLVYNGGAVPLVANQWINFTLTTPFNYNGTDNLVVFFRDMTGSYVSGNSSYGTEGASGVSRYIYQDGGAYTVGSTTGGTTSTFRCNLVFGGMSAQCIQQSTCAAPVAYVTGITSTTASIVWAPGNTETSWNLYYRLAGASTFTAAATGVTATNYTFTGLLSGMPYELKVENDCSGESLSCVVEATTECANITVLPFVEDFNNWGTGTGTLPNCWYRTGSYSTYSYISPSYNMSGSTGGSVYMYQGSSSPYTSYASTLILPALDTSLYQANQTQLVFSTMYATASYGRPKFEIGVVSDPMDFSTFVPVDTVQHSGGINLWESFEVPLAAYTGNGAYVAMRTVYDSTYTYAYVDNITLELIPTCPRPDTLTASNATTNSVDLGWHERGAATTWIIEHGPVGFALGTGTQVVATSNPFTLTGLPAAYQGEYYVKSVCGAGDTSEFSRAPYSFNTSQVPASIPYNYDFEDPAEWANWQTSSNSATNNWFRGTAVADSGNYSLYMSADSGLTYTPYTHTAIVNAAAYRDIDFGTVDSSFTLSFRARVGGTISNRYDGLMVFLVDPSLSTVPSNSGITSPWGNVNDLYRIATVYLDTTWQTYEASFDTIHGVHRVAFFWFNQNTQASNPNLGEPAAVDNLHINYSSCPRPLNLDTVATTGSTATLTWTGEASATYQVIYRQVGSTNHTAYTNTNSITLTGLASAAEHVAWVRKLCGAGDTSLWSDNTTFYTKLCDGAVEMSNAPSTGTAYYTPLNNFYNYTLTETIIDSAELVGLSNITTIAYEYAYTTASSVKTDVTIWLQPTNKTTFSSSSDVVALDTSIAVQVYTGPLNCEQGWNFFAFSNPYVWDGHSNLLVIVDDNSGDYDGSLYVFNTTSTGSDYKTIHYYSDSYNPDPLSPSSFSGTKSYVQYRATMRLISCGVGCTAPSASVAAVDYQSATIVAAGTGSSYELNYGTDPSVLGTTEINTTGVFNLSGLNPNTQYFFEVRQLCDSSTWSSVAYGTFTTDELPCFTPDSLEVVATSFSTATLHWISTGNATQWVVEVNGAGVQRFDTVGTNPYTVQNLYADQDYTASVRAICLTGVVESDWSDTIAFHTDACLPVSGVSVNDTTSSGATASWQPTTGALGYRVSYGYYDFYEVDATRVDLNANTTSYTFTDLAPETHYEFYVQTRCGEGLYSVVSASDRVDFNTAAESQGIYDVESGTLTLFPNPASTSVTLTVSGIDGEVTVEIVDLNGRKVSELRTQNSSLTIDVASMAQGAYFVRVTGDRQTAVRKLIVR